jgi:hypothetical protein
MKKIVSALAVLAVVGSALAFKPYGAGTIYCFANSQVPNVKAGFSCNDLTQQPASSRKDFAVSQNPNDPTDNPCLSTQTPFNGATSGSCLQTTPGTTHYVATAQ